MKLKTLTSVIAVACLLGSAAFGETPQPQGAVRIAGTITKITATQIIMTSSTDTWTITKNPQSLPILISGTMVENSNATLQCNSPDSQKKEGPTTPTPTPTGTPQSR